MRFVLKDLILFTLLQIASSLYRRRFTVITIVGLLLLFYFWPSNCHALEVSVTEGYSVTKAAPNGVWKQDGFFYKHNLDSKSHTIAVSSYPLSWLKLTGGFKNYGNIDGYLEYVSDENYSSNPNNPCRNPCEAPRSATFTGTANGAFFGAAPTLRFSGGELGLGIGRIFYYAQTLITAKNYRNNFIKDPNPSIGIYNEENIGSSWIYSLNFSYKNFRFFYSQAPKIKAGFDGLQRGIEEFFFALDTDNGSLLLGIDRRSHNVSLAYTWNF